MNIWRSPISATWFWNNVNDRDHRRDVVGGGRAQPGTKIQDNSPFLVLQKLLQQLKMHLKCTPYLPKTNMQNKFLNCSQHWCVKNVMNLSFLLEVGGVCYEQAYKARKYITLSIHNHAVHGKNLFRSYLSQILMDFAHFGVILQQLNRVYFWHSN